MASRSSGPRVAGDAGHGGRLREACEEGNRARQRYLKRPKTLSSATRPENCSPEYPLEPYGGEVIFDDHFSFSTMEN